MLPVRTVFCPTDFSERAAPALDVATALARDYSARLVIVHVAPPPILASNLGASVELPTGWETQTRARLDALRVGEQKVPVTRILAIGDPAAEILRLAETCRADLIVMGTHGRTGMARLLAGSVAEVVSRAAPCPVLTIRAPFPLPLSGPGVADGCAEPAEGRPRAAGGSAKHPEVATGV